MKHLLDVNLVIAGIVTTHPQHAVAAAWLPNKEVILCPMSELGFLRIATNPRLMGFTMTDARRLLQNFATFYKAARIPADMNALDSHPATFAQVTDHYLADLAASHGLKLATLDQDLKHPAVQLVL